jgi:hypothetical protein
MRPPACGEAPPGCKRRLAESKMHHINVALRRQPQRKTRALVRRRPLVNIDNFVTAVMLSV